jgi:5'(3')-deoxyribonucleotidase
MRTIYLDMDGVVADFNKFASDLLGREVSWEGKDLNEEEWLRLAQIRDLYYRLPLIEESTKLVGTAKSLSTRFKVEFLTAVPRITTMPTAAEDKRRWLDEYYPGFKVNFGPFSRDKYKWARPGDILVDDKRSNISEWFEAGGVGILHLGDFDVTVANLLKAVDNIDPCMYNFD